MPRTNPSPKNRYFEIRRSLIQGRGAFALRAIRKGTRVIEYTGEIIDDDEADRRYADEGMSRHHTFLFAIDGGVSIDGAAGGNEARFINHSCDPNCESIEVDGQIFIEAKRTIRPEEELLYDYGYARTSATTPEDEAFYRCRCGAATCRGTILADAKPKARKPAKKRVTKKPAPKKPAPKKPAPKKPTTRKPAPKKPASRKKASPRRKG